MNLPLWICLISVIQSIVPDCFVLSSILRAATNLTTCDIETNICSTQVSIAAGLIAPTDYLSFRTLDTNADFKIYFENITLNFVLSPFVKHTVVDGKLIVDKVNSCGSNRNTALCDWLVPRFDAKIKYKCFRRFYYHDGACYTCYCYWLSGAVEYTLYRSFGYQLDKLNFVYKKKAYSVRQHETIELPDFNFTFVTGQAMTVPLEVPAILINPLTAQIFVLDKQFVNGPNDYFTTKAGYFKPVNIFDSCYWNLPSADPPFMADHLKLTPLSYFPEYKAIPFAVRCPLDPNPLSKRLTNETIIGYSTSDKGGKDIKYTTGVQDRTKVEIDGLVTDLCTSWPDICICSSLSPLTCLDVEGLIKVKSSTNGTRMAYLKDQRIWAQEQCNGPIFSLTQVPNLVDIQIEGSNIIPKIDVSSCRPIITIKYETDVIYIKANCSYLPCIVNTDTLFSENVTASTKQTVVELEPDWMWVQIVCLRTSQKFYKNQAVDVSNVTGNATVISHNGPEVPDDGNIFDTIFGAVGKAFVFVFDVVKTPFVFLWDLITDPFGFIGDIFSKLASNLLFWVLMVFGGLVSLCMNGVIVTVIAELVAWQVYTRSTATAAIIALVGCLIGYKVLETLWNLRKQQQATEATEATAPLIEKSTELT